ncbi:MAG: tRNA 2-thiouridine(34) synthase MnmA [Actinobacteria bacterium]|nr:tRNA 2-thiouridine(34) synthase MnmA [Actinomycetota bacterium]
MNDERVERAQKAVVALSGGVDSAFAAYFLKEKGVKVTGVFFKMFPENSSISRLLPLNRQQINLERARVVAETIGIDFRVVDVSNNFETEVINYFVNEYLKGRTPNPCTFCNPKVKFSELLNVAKDEKADIVATGHYAKVIQTKNQSFALSKAEDKSKDQSYYLYRLSEAMLKKIYFPNGFFYKKDIKERIKNEIKLLSFETESQEVCFISTTYQEFIKKFYPESLKPGPIILKDGTIVGEHSGIAFYTVGQRKGLKVSLGRKYYVIKIDAKNNTIILGTEDDLSPSGIEVSNLNFIAGKPPNTNFPCKVKVRYRAKEISCLVNLLSKDRAEIKFLEKCLFPAPGQSAVLYDGNLVLGGGIIEKWL